VETGFDMGTGFGGVTLVRDDPREENYSDDPAPAAQAEAVQRMAADRAYLEWNAKQHYVWKDAYQIYGAYDAAATLIMLRRIGYEPHWTEEERKRFDEWCVEHEEHVRRVVEMIE